MTLGFLAVFFKCSGGSYHGKSRYPLVYSGYAFINFLDPTNMIRFQERFEVARVVGDGDGRQSSISRSLTWLSKRLSHVFGGITLLVNQDSWLEYPHFLIGNTSSIRVHFPASYVSLPEGRYDYIWLLGWWQLKYVLCSSQTLGKWSNLTSIFFRRVETTN